MGQRVMITGAAGMLGTAMSRTFAGSNEFRVFNLDRHKVDYLSGEYLCADLTNDGEVKRMFSEVRPDILVHCAANVNLDDCEANREAAYALHVEAVRRLAELAGSKVRGVFVSTDSVHEGTRGDYTEADVARPLNYYAETKLLGEQQVLSNSSCSLVLRVNIYGFHIDERRSLTEWAIENLKMGNPIDGFDDIIFNPLYVGQLARAIYTLAPQREVVGILNLGCREVVSKYEFLRRVASEFGYGPDLVRRSSVTNVPFKVRRPSNTSLNLRKAEGILGILPSIDEGIRDLRSDYERQFAGR